MRGPIMSLHIALRGCVARTEFFHSKKQETMCKEEPFDQHDYMVYKTFLGRGNGA